MTTDRSQRSRARIRQWVALMSLLAVGTAGLGAPGRATATSSGRAAGGPQVQAFGGARDHGSLPSPPVEPVVGIAATPSGDGYWLASSNGGVFAFGGAGYFGSAADLHPNSPIVGMAATPSGSGYWLVAADGGVFAFGDAGFFGSTGDIRLNQPIVGMARTPTGGGYWFVAADGGVFAFGDAGFFGSTGDIRLNQPIVGMASTPSGGGYWFVAADGGVFTFGRAEYFGSMVDSMPEDAEAVGIAAAPAGNGYWIAAGPGAIRVVVAGDVHGERRIRSLLDAGDNPLALVAGELRGADVAIVNLETPVGSGGSPQPKQYVFLAPPSLPHALASGGVDVVSLGNNHALDHGRGALLETIDHARAAGLQVVGAGADAAAAFRPALVRVRGRTVAVVGLSRVVPAGWAATGSTAGVASAYAESTAVNAVRQAAQQADYVVVVVHWGTELARCPDGHLMRLASVLRDAGADVIAGHHPHVLQGARAERSAVVAYSLGNFVWYHSDPPSDTTALLEVTLAGGRVDDWRLRPGRFDRAGRPYLSTGADADRLSSELAALTPGAGRCPG